MLSNIWKDMIMECGADVRISILFDIHCFVCFWNSMASPYLLSLSAVNPCALQWDCLLHSISFMPTYWNISFTEIKCGSIWKSRSYSSRPRASRSLLGDEPLKHFFNSDIFLNFATAGWGWLYFLTGIFL